MGDEGGSSKSGGRDVSGPLAPRTLSTSSGVPTAGEVAEQDSDSAESERPGPNGRTPGGAGTQETSDGPARQDSEPNADRGASGSEHTMNDSDDKPRRSRVSARQAAHNTGVAVNYVRSKIASIVWLIALSCAVVLALGAILVALEANPDNGIVSFFDDLAHRIDGPFADMFTFSGKDAAKKEILVNWGIGAVAYLIIGRILDRIIRP